MKNNNNSSSSGGIGFCGLLTIVFIVLKLCGVITWSWWWVLSPLWISTIIGLVIVAIWLAVISHSDRGSGKWKF
jgi:hypothetical protein